MKRLFVFVWLSLGGAVYADFPSPFVVVNGWQNAIVVGYVGVNQDTPLQHLYLHVPPGGQMRFYGFCLDGIYVWDASAYDQEKTNVGSFDIMNSGTATASVITPSFGANNTVVWVGDSSAQAFDLNHTALYPVLNLGILTDGGPNEFDTYGDTGFGTRNLAGQLYDPYSLYWAAAGFAFGLVVYGFAWYRRIARVAADESI